MWPRHIRINRICRATCVDRTLPSIVAEGEAMARNGGRGPGRSHAPNAADIVSLSCRGWDPNRLAASW